MKITRTMTIETNEIQIGDRIRVGHYTATCQKLVGEGLALFLLDQYLDKPMQMNRKNTNAGGYDASDLRKELNSGKILDEFAPLELVPFENGDLLRLPFTNSAVVTALTKVADDRHFNPLREYIQALPEWDGVARVDTLLIDYLGAEDTAYTRAVTRKTLVGAVQRVLQPGCKFDTMLVLDGPPGIGKSTLLRKLGGEWFDDSLSLADTRDKTAAEKLQGKWIMEIGEMQGTRKTDIDIVKGFGLFLEMGLG